MKLWPENTGQPKSARAFLLSSPMENEKFSFSIENVHFRIPEEEWYIYPTWLVRYIQAIIVPLIVLSAISTKILMKKEIKQYLCGNSIYPVHN